MATGLSNSFGSEKESESPISFRYWDKGYMAQQLPNLQERAPILMHEPLEITTNAPSTLPTPPLYPGEILKMQQHRVICTNAFNEPAVGVVYLTNFRIIFNGSPISDPDVYSMVHEFFQYSHAKRDSNFDTNVVTPSLPRTLRNRKRKHPVRNSKFYVGGEEEEYGDETGEEHIPVSGEGNPSLSSKVFHRLNTFRRSTGAGIKNALTDLSDRSKVKTINERRHQTSPSHLESDHVSGHKTISLPLSNPLAQNITVSDVILSTSAPNNHEPRVIPSDKVTTTLPRTMPSHVLPQQRDGSHGNQSSSYQTTDSGFVDPPLSKATSLDLDVETVQEKEEVLSISPDNVFLPPPQVDEVDFERSPIDFPLQDIRRRAFQKPHYFRPDSLLAIESDSEDSDTATDTFFGSIAEDDDYISSPENDSPSPTHVRNKDERVSIVIEPPEYPEYINVPTLKERGKKKIIGKDVLSMDDKKPYQHLYSKPHTSTSPIVPDINTRPHPTSPDINTRPHPTSPDINTRPHPTSPDINTRLHPTSPDINTRPHPTSPDINTRPHSTSPDINTRPHPTSPDINTRPHPTSPDINTRPHPTSPDINTRPHPTSPDINTRPHSTSPDINGRPHQSDIDKQLDSTQEDPITTEGPPKKPPRKKKLQKQVKSLDEDLISNGRKNEKETLVLGPDVKPRINRPRRTPPPRPPRPRPPPSPPVVAKLPLHETSGESSINLNVTMVTESPRQQPVASDSTRHSLSPELFLPTGGEDEFKNNRSSSLIANRSSNASLMRRLTVSSPLDPPYSFDWPSHSGSHIIDRRGMNTWSDPRLNAKMIPYIQYTLSMSIPLQSIHIYKHLPPATLDIYGCRCRLPDGFLVLGRNSVSMKLYLHSQNTVDAVKLKEYLEQFLSSNKHVYESFAFKYRSSVKISHPRLLDSRKLPNFYLFEAEIDRLGILDAKILNSQLWRVTNITKDNPKLCHSYPDKLVVLICTPDVDLIRGASIYQEGRFPVACWMNHDNEAVLLRAAATTSERGLQGSNLPVDEAILQAIRKCNKGSRLFVFTEKSDNASFQDPTKLTAAAARSYYYHNCNFVYTINPPSFKNIRHSFNKLQAMIQNEISDDEYLVALYSTHWLERIGELLHTTSKVCRALTEESAHVLVCYENGWDRTTQIVSLAQLLCDPYYRTMNGFQVLVQKEWIWFGHPFQKRNGHHHNSKIKEDGPVFLQWIDCVWQVMRQCPFAFEFNENLLLAIVEHSYSDQFGTFLMNAERERNQCFMIPNHYHQSVNQNTISFWTWVSMMNASSQIFYNPLYDNLFHPCVIYPKYYQTCLELWRNHYEREKVRMELQEASPLDSRLYTELRQLITLFQERRPEFTDHTFGTGVTNSLNSLTFQFSTRSGNESMLLGPNPLPTSSSSPSPRIIRTRSDKVYTSIMNYLSSEGYDASICHHVIISSTMAQGYLVKEGGFMKNWKKRWFVLDFVAEYFAYFETDEHFHRKEAPKGVISLDQIKRVSLSSKRIHLMSNLFQVRTPLRTYNIKAPSIISMEIWMACLKLPPSSLVVPNP